MSVEVREGAWSSDSADRAAEETRLSLVLSHLWLADALARRYRGRGVEADELEQEARSALVEAAHRFDPSVGAFAPFAAATVTGLLKRYFRDHGWSVRPPRHLQQLAVQIGAEWSAASQAAGREPTRGDLAARLGHSSADIDLARQASQNYRTASLDDDSRPVPPAAAVDPEFLRCESRLLIERLLPQLDQSDRELIRWRFWDDRSQADIAHDLGVSQMQVSRMLARALARLRRVYADGDTTLALPPAVRSRRRRSPAPSGPKRPGIRGDVATGPAPVPASAA